MSAVSTIVLADGAATPVNHNFVPSRVSADLVSYQDRSPGVIAGFNLLTIGTRFADKRNTAQKVSVRLVLPTLATVSPSTESGIQPLPIAAYECFANVDFVLPAGSTTQNRKDLFALFKNLAAHAVIQAALVDLDPPY